LFARRITINLQPLYRTGFFRRSAFGYHLTLPRRKNLVRRTGGIRLEQIIPEAGRLIHARAARKELLLT